MMAKDGIQSAQMSSINPKNMPSREDAIMRAQNSMVEQMLD